MLRTEAISNRVTSALLGMQMDVSAGSRGFSRAAARCLVEHARPGWALGADAEWLVVLQRSGFKLDYITIDGLDWEIADQYQRLAANPEQPRRAAEAYDADLQHWTRRIAVAFEIVESGLEAAARMQKKDHDL